MSFTNKYSVSLSELQVLLLILILRASCDGSRPRATLSLPLCGRAEKVLMGERRTIRGANHETRIRDIWERAHKGDDRWRDVCFFQRQFRVELDDKTMTFGGRYESVFCHFQTKLDLFYEISFIVIKMPTFYARIIVSLCTK